MKQIAVSGLPQLLEAMAALEALYLPVQQGRSAQFTRYEAGMELSQDLNTGRSAKDLFFPQVENLVDFQVSGKNIEVVERRDPGEDFILFGVRACDCRSFDILDRVFLSEPQDTFYASRRSRATVVTLACHAPEETCFCTVFGIDPADPAGDVTAWMTKAKLCLRANTKKGEKLLAALPMLQDGGEDAVVAEQAAIHAVTEKLPLKDLNLTGFDGDHLMEKFNSPQWAQLSQSCLGCGSCTFVCPTCQCYDIKDFNTGHGIQRFRCWDSCMYSDFTMMAHGTNRPTQLERFRQRFMHKLVYFPANNDGIYGCVGCGRCLKKCPISMNIVKVIKTLGEGTT
ncbi:MAG TPA: 4Fe-4S dicluster domain-containing protein [Candidatus Avoscillospira stercorigallinarum]|uniref:4Fe-4S dicluster domain-containing protein n=1 Tax=Candidatus Avoscillospira stercorigallinarum TaxID=2840708 RepID=A0A9D1CPA3_9FIRM|nr:4Fe-4S dicluster domain-containing protein [Candidatus Avoscillospira stercorigallinarum]